MSKTPEIFVGRTNDRRMFKNSVGAMLALPGQPAEAPNLFLIDGEHGMGKSALLREFARMACEAGVAAQRTLLIDLAGAEYSTPRDLAAALVASLRKLSNRAFSAYDDLVVQRFQRQAQYDELRQQWERWQSLQAYGQGVIDRMLNENYGIWRQKVLRRTLFGAGYAATHVAGQLERAVDQLSSILQFREIHKRSPQSFDELLTWTLKQDAGLFRHDERFGDLLAAAIRHIAVRTPLVLLIDGYEQADRHDDWMRSMLAQLSGKVLVAIAGRRRLIGAYQQKFATRLAYVDVNLPLDDHDVQEYLGKRLGLLPEQIAPLLGEVTTIARGVPLVMAALGDQLAGGATLLAYRGLPDGMPEPDAYQRAAIARFFEQVLGSASGGAGSQSARLHDRQRLRMLALLRPDPKLLAAGWGLSAEETLTEEASLAERYRFIFNGVAPLDMHPLIREVAQANARAARKRQSEWQPIASGLQRALALVEERIRRYEEAFTAPAARYSHADWRQATLDRIHLLLWLGRNEQARDTLLAHWVEASYESPVFANRLFERAAKIAPRSVGWPQVLAALQTEDCDLLPPHIAGLEPQTQAILGLLRARRLPLPTVNADTITTLDRRIELLGAAVAQAPKWSPVSVAYTEALSARGHYVLYERKDYAAAIADFSTLIELDPKYPAAYSRRGFAHYASGDDEAALEDFSRALNVQPEDTGARFGRASTLVRRYEQQRWTNETKAAEALLETALEDLDKIIQRFPNDAAARYYRGRILLWRDELVRATRDLRASRRLDPGRAATHSALGLAWAALAKQEDQRQPITATTTQKASELWPMAVKAAQHACESAPEDPEAWSNRGLIALDMGQPIDAANYFEQALKLRPDHAPSLFYRSRAHLGVGDLDAATEDIKHALVLQPACADFYTLRAEIALRQADRAYKMRHDLLQQAYDDAERALELRPRDPAALVWRAHVAALQSKLEAALVDITLAISLQAGTTHAYAVRGYIRQQQAELAEQSQQAKLYSDALSDLEATPSGSDEWAETFARRGLVRHARGDYEDAVEDFDLALTIRQNDPQFLFWRGRSCAKNPKKHGEAIENYKASLDAQKDQPDVLYERGRLLLDSNKPEEAVKDFAAVLKLRPRDAQALAKLAEAKRRSGDMIGAMPHYWTQVGTWTRRRLARSKEKVQSSEFRVQSAEQP